MDYSFEVRISLEKPIVKDYVQMMVEKALKEINFSPLMGEKEGPTVVEVVSKMKK